MPSACCSSHSRPVECPRGNTPFAFTLRAYLRIPSSTPVALRWTMLSTLAPALLSSYYDRRVAMSLHRYVDRGVQRMSPVVLAGRRWACSPLRDVVLYREVSRDRHRYSIVGETPWP